MPPACRARSGDLGRSGRASAGSASRNESTPVSPASRARGRAAPGQAQTSHPSAGRSPSIRAPSRAARRCGARAQDELEPRARPTRAGPARAIGVASEVRPWPREPSPQVRRRTRQRRRGDARPRRQFGGPAWGSSRHDPHFGRSARGDFRGFFRGRRYARLNHAPKGWMPGRRSSRMVPWARSRTFGA